MPRLTISLTEEQNEWVEQQADERDRSKTWVIQALIDAQRGDGEAFTTSVPSGDIFTNHHPPEFTDVVKRLNELEARMDALESAPDQTAEPSRSTARAAVDDHSDAQEQERDSGRESGLRIDAGLEERVEAWEPEGEVSDRRAREAALSGVAWLQSVDGPQSRQQFLDAVHEDNGLSERVWWERCVQPFLSKLADDGLVRYRPGHHDYEWVG